MKGYRFYEEFENKHKGISAGTVVAVELETRRYYRDLCIPHHDIGAVAAVFDHPNSGCTFTAVSFDYLRTKCKRISEARAREIHPHLFDYLEADHE